MNLILCATEINTKAPWLHLRFLFGGLVRKDLETWTSQLEKEGQSQ